jgi:TetR/AcrR family transcriptional repressor of nem operon
VSQAEKEKSHARIVAGASRLMRERGLDGASVDEVMKAAGMTHGGFYKHFDGKEALIEEALAAAFADFVEPLERGDPERAAAAYRALYLSEGHKNHPGLGCPVASLGPDIGRAPARIKAAFGAGVRRTVAALGRVRKGSASNRETAAFRDLSMLVGAIVIARASDAETARAVLAACKRPW